MNTSCGGRGLLGEGANHIVGPLNPAVMCHLCVSLFHCVFLLWSHVSSTLGAPLWGSHGEAESGRGLSISQPQDYHQAEKRMFFSYMHNLIPALELPPSRETHVFPVYAQSSLIEEEENFWDSVWTLKQLEDIVWACRILSKPGEYWSSWKVIFCQRRPTR